MADKRKAIFDFLQLSSPTSIFTSSDQEILKKAESLVTSARLAIRKGRKKNDTSAPAVPQWNAGFCAKFIIDFHDLFTMDQMKRDKRLRGRNSSRPRPVGRLIDMYEKAKGKVKEDVTISNKRRTRKHNTRSPIDSSSIDGRSVKNASDHYIKAFPHQNMRLQPSQIQNLSVCPECNHFSMAPIEAKEDIRVQNEAVKADFERRMRAWVVGGRQGAKPRSGKTASQTLGCFCFQQNCLGNPGGTGCFKCIESPANVEMIVDPW